MGSHSEMKSGTLAPEKPDSVSLCIQLDSPVHTAAGNAAN
jgi:hypothetical protein